METGLGREDQRPLDPAHLMAVLAGQLDGGLIGFGAGIAEEDAVGAAAPNDPAGQFLLLGDPVEVGDVLKPAQLFAQGPAHHSVAVAEGAGGDPGHAVEVATPVLVTDPHPPAFDELERQAGIGVHHRRNRGVSHRQRCLGLWRGLAGPRQGDGSGGT